MSAAKETLWGTRVYFTYERVSLEVYGKFPWGNDVWDKVWKMEGVKEDSGDYLKQIEQDIKMEGKMVLSRNRTKSNVVKCLWIWGKCFKMII